MAAKEKTNGAHAPGKGPAVAVADPPGPVAAPAPQPATIPDAEVVATRAVVPAPQPAGPVIPVEVVRAREAVAVELVQQVPRSLAAALAEAQAKCGTATKAGRNSHHGYRYATAETIIATAKDALASTGLAVIPGRTAVVHDEGGPTLVRKFVLVHAGGQTLECESVWPIVEERGRPLDKATAIATTTSLAYFLRDLLLMPRAAGEMDERADAKPAKSGREVLAEREAAKRAQAQQPAQQPAPGNGKATPDQLARLKDLREQLFAETKPADPKAAWAALLAFYKADTATALTADQAAHLIGQIAHQLTTLDVERAMHADTKGG